MHINYVLAAVVSKFGACFTSLRFTFRPEESNMATKEDPSSKQLRIQVCLGLCETAKNFDLVDQRTTFSAAWNLPQNVEGGCVLRERSGDKRSESTENA